MLMRIDEITFKNFRKFVDINIIFNKNLTNDLQLIIADNGVGKTTFSNAITWCLYNVEPKIEGREKEAYTVLNSKIVDDAKDDEIISAFVSIKVSDGDKSILFRREEFFKIHSVNDEYYEENGFREESIEQKLSIIFTDGNNPPISVRDENEQLRFISSFVPESIKEFFFFDNEKLDNYFLINSNIEKQTEKLSHIQALKNMKTRIPNVIDDYDDKIIKTPESKKLYQEYLDLKSNLNDVEDDLGEYNAEYNILNKEFEDLVKKLRGIASVTDLLADLDDIEERIEKNTISLEKEQKYLNDLVIKKAPYLFVKGAIDETLSLLESNKPDDLEYIDEKYLELSIQDKKCLLCDHSLDNNSIDVIREKILKFYSFPPEIKKLEKFKLNYLNILKNNGEYINQDEKYENSIDILEQNVSDYENDKAEIKSEIDKIIDKKKDTDRRDELEFILLPQLRSKILNSKQTIKILNKKVKDKYDEYEKALGDESKVNIINNKKLLLQKSLDVVEKTYSKIMVETRNLIEKETNTNFKKTIRKTRNFDRIKLNDDYKITMYQGDRVVTVSASAAETQILALSFALAVHSISNYDAPLIIDTPLARVNGKNKILVAEAYFNLGKERETILIMMDDEYTDKVKTVFEKEPVDIIYFEESDDESQIIMRRKKWKG